MTGHIIVGTAGHVDHGKTLLTAALTGVDTDRLPEEKKRSMTIVPGYVQLELPGGVSLGLADVPGHEKFIKNMLAGVGGIDMALLVIAADEGVMPQTEEHVHILHLLGIRKAVVAITKCDMVGDDPEWLEMIHGQTAELLEPTAMKGAEVIDVSAVTGRGIPELRQALGRAAASLKERPHVGIARLPVDRVFSKQGFGTIATGTLWAGSVSIEDVLEQVPGGASLRVRGLQVHGQPVETALAGQRTAINLAGAQADRIKPGCWLAEPGLLKPGYRLDVSLDLLKSAGTLKHRARLHVFHGTMQVSGRVRLLDREAATAGESCLCQLELEEPLPVLRGDRLILRAWSPEVTIAGATVLDPNPPRYRLNSAKTMPAISGKAGRDDSRILLDILDTEARAMTLKALIKSAQLPEASVRAALEELLHSRRAIQPCEEELYVSAELCDSWKQELLRQLRAFHKRYPLRPGVPEAELRQKVFGRMEARHAGLVLAYLEGAGAISRRNGLLSLPGYTCTPNERQAERLERIAATYRKKLFVPPVWEELMASFKIPEPEGLEYQIYLVSNGTLVRLEDEHFHAEALDIAAAKLKAACPAGFTVAEARDVLGTTRKYVLPLLAGLDGQGITIREGDTRTFPA